MTDQQERATILATKTRVDAALARLALHPLTGDTMRTDLRERVAKILVQIEELKAENAALNATILELRHAHA